MTEPIPDAGIRQRATDKGILCNIALRAGQFWDFIDNRDIDKHTVSLAILYGTIKVMAWAMAFAEDNTEKTGIEIAAIIAAVGTPYMALQAAALAFYFKART